MCFPVQRQPRRHNDSTERFPFLIRDEDRTGPVSSHGAHLHYCDKLTSVTFEEREGWYMKYPNDDMSGGSLDMTDSKANAEKLRGEWCHKELAVAAVN